MFRYRSRFTLLLTALLFMTLQGCAAMSLIGYKISPDYPQFDEGDQIQLAGLADSVQVRQQPDGMWEIVSQNDHDAFMVGGYLQGRDRMFQLDLLRHLAQGRLGELVGDVKLGAKSSLQLDIYNRFLGLWDQAKNMAGAIDPEEMLVLEAAVDGINAWIAEEHLSLEHRLLGVKDIRPWTVIDSLSILRLFMFNLTHNYTRELRRLLLVCATDFETMETVWPSVIEFPIHFLPDEMLKQGVHSGNFEMPLAIVEPVRDELQGLCPAWPSEADEADKGSKDGFKPDMGLLTPDGEGVIRTALTALEQLSTGLEASNSWVVAGSRTASGAPILSNDPHLAHLNPPVVWGVHIKTPNFETAGFSLVGLHRIVMGTNGKVAWGSTINNVDMQDLFVLKPVGPATTATSYIMDGQARPFIPRTETFDVKGDASHEVTVRYSIHGPVLNDMDSWLSPRIPLTALHLIDFSDAQDVRAARNITYSNNVEEWVAAISDFDTACISWVVADAKNIGWTSPCRIPIRKKWLGTFPAPGWLSEYIWEGTYGKEEFVGSSINPSVGYIATSNNRPLPVSARSTAYNNDPSSPNRYRQIKRGLEKLDKIELQDMADLQMDVEFGYWEDALATVPGWCDGATDWKKKLCDWDRQATSDSIVTTVFVMFTHALLDQNMATRLPGGVEGKLWHFLQDIPHFEQNTDWMFLRANDDVLWDIPGTKDVETKNDAFDRALTAALQETEKRYGAFDVASDGANWQWGTVRPFILKHIFGGKSALASTVNGPAFRGLGLPNTVFKNQFNRSSRDSMHPTAGPAFRINMPMERPWEGIYTFSGGESGWPKAPHYGDHTEGWLTNKPLPLIREGGVRVVFVPGGVAK